MGGYLESVPCWSDEYMYKQAEKNGCTAELANDRVLQLDLDDDASYEFFQKQFAVLKSLNVVLIEGYSVRSSKSGVGRHVVVALAEDVQQEHRILLQACLGSDRKRELLSFAGHVFGQEHPVVLFRPKGDA